jgi:hypothetical protein
MSATTDRCRVAKHCTSHARLALEATPAADAAAAASALDRLATELAAARSRSPRSELRACGELLAQRLRTDRDGGDDALRLDRVLASGRGAPVTLGAIAVTAARQAGIALGLLSGAYGRVVVAHATLPAPLVLDLQADFALRDIAGDEPLHRWLCAHETARRVQDQLHPAAPPLFTTAAPRARRRRAATGAAAAPALVAR